MIKNHPPDKALQFANLYSRLLVQPVLDQKWAILYLLYQLSDSASAATVSLTELPIDIPHVLRPQTSQASTRTSQRQPENGRPGTSMRRREDKVYDEAFAPRGLPSLPVREHLNDGPERAERPQRIMREDSDRSERRRQQDQIGRASCRERVF